MTFGVLSLYTVYFCGQSAHSENLPGLFESPEDVRQYEQHWHYLYKARMHGLGKKVSVPMYVYCICI